MICLLGQGCSKLLNVDNPDNKITGVELFKDNEAAESAVLGIYSAASGTSSLLSGSITVYAGLYADELIYTSTQVSTTEFYHGPIAVNNTVLESNFWNNTYRFIYQVNACLEGLHNSTSLSSGVKARLTGECRFLRALFYFYMIQLFGDVPLVTVTNYNTNENMPRTSVAQVKDSILADLLNARELLSEEYPSNEKVRANKWAAVALLARYYLYEEKWTKAEAAATEIITSNVYQLDEPNKVFLANSSEAILQLRPVLAGYNTMEGNMFLPTSTSRPVYPLSGYLTASFERNDKRRSAWVNSKVVSGVTYYYPYKYKQKVNFTSSFKLTEYSMMLRLAEIYLVRAECRVHLEQLSGAIADIDVIRSRAGLPLVAVTAPDISSALLNKKIQQERRIEFFAEWGHRWFDLKRTGKAYETMITIKPGWKETQHLWPIPYPQISLNPYLTQNPGYF
ncbi:RagB/SusD family nutrient uptake outer membrane protein [Chitinophaga tropicalis]|nr:RagB/SusD family nutrient uptake outer membrane protein [Chitinophaga tropicalis]